MQAFCFPGCSRCRSVVQLGVGLYHFFKYAAFDNHEAGWCVMNLHKAFFIDFQDDFAVFIFVVGIDGVRSVHALENRLGSCRQEGLLGASFRV